MFRLIVALSLLCLALAANDDRIVNGRQATIAEHPYQVSIQQSRQHFCGGSIINQNWILTAAHCLDDIIKNNNVGQLTIRAGSSRRDSGGIEKNVQMAINHPEYNSKTMVFDVGLMRLGNPLVYSVTIKPIKLAKTLPADGTTMVVSGWGKLGENVAGLPAVLQAVEVDFYGMSACRNPKLKYGQSIQPSMVCAMAPNKDSCQGDSGGPMMIANTHQQVGVVSWGVGCATPGMPGVYCDVTHPKVSGFIAQHVGPY